MGYFTREMNTYYTNSANQTAYSGIRSIQFCLQLVLKYPLLMSPGDDPRMLKKFVNHKSAVVYFDLSLDGIGKPDVI